MCKSTSIPWKLSTEDQNLELLLEHKSKAVGIQQLEPVSLFQWALMCFSGSYLRELLLDLSICKFDIAYILQFPTEINTVTEFSFSFFFILKISSVRHKNHVNGRSENQLHLVKECSMLLTFSCLFQLAYQSHFYYVINCLINVVLVYLSRILRVSMGFAIILHLQPQRFIKPSIVSLHYAYNHFSCCMFQLFSQLKYRGF